MDWITTVAGLLALLLPKDVPTDALCPQWDPLHPVVHAQIAAELDLVYASPDFKHTAYRALAGAVRIPTESRDGSGPVDQDPVWHPFTDFHLYLQQTFPLVYEKLNVTTVNTYGLVFHWGGSTDAKPFLSTAHQDVVPVDPSTLSQWEHPPYSGDYDGTWIWGRGTCDDKGDLIQKLVVIDTLLRHGFTPARTIVLAFGFDEETTGQQGAGHLATYLQQRYGRDGFAMILDEGGSSSHHPCSHSQTGGVQEYSNGVYFALPSLSEKGYLDVRIQVTAPGGHSSQPPEHTSIGYLAQFITTLEENPHVPQLVRNGTPFHSIMCLAEYSPSFPDHLRSTVRKAVSDDTALEHLKRALLELSPVTRATLGTTQAADILEGGVKVNALPERAAVIVNHRIAEHSSVSELRQHLVQVLYPVAHKYDLTFSAFGRVVHTGQAGEVSIADEYDSALDPSPVTPTGYGPYSILAGTIRATMESSRFYNVTKVVVSPALSLGNTDTQFYWNLTTHIFRFSPFTFADSYNGLHTVNEALRAEAMVEAIRFHTNFILNLDESPLP